MVLGSKGRYIRYYKPPFVPVCIRPFLKLGVVYTHDPLGLTPKSQAFRTFLQQFLANFRDPMVHGFRKSPPKKSTIWMFWNLSYIMGYSLPTSTGWLLSDFWSINTREMVGNKQTSVKRLVVLGPPGTTSSMIWGDCNLGVENQIMKFGHFKYQLSIQ